MDNPELIEKLEHDLDKLVQEYHKKLPYAQMIFPLSEILENTRLKARVEKEFGCRCK